MSEDETVEQQVEATFDLSKLEKTQDHEWVQRGRFLGCHCHPQTGVFLPADTNLVNVKDGQPVFEKKGVNMSNSITKAA